MAMNTNPDGTIDVRVVLTVQVDPHAWARDVMDEDPDEVLQKNVRRDVKKAVRDRIAEWPMDGEVPIGEVTAQGLYDHSPVTRRS